MKSVFNITKSGTKIHDAVTKEFIKDVLQENGLKFSEHKEYELWICPSGKTDLWYIIKNCGTRKKVIKWFGPTEQTKYTNDYFKVLSNKIQEKEDKIAKLQEELLQMKTKKKVNDIQKEYGLERFMPQILSE